MKIIIEVLKDKQKTRVLSKLTNTKKTQIANIGSEKMGIAPDLDGRGNAIVTGPRPPLRRKLQTPAHPGQSRWE